MINFGNTVVIAAHPDDETLGAGGTIPLIKAAGHNVSVVIVTDGSSTQYEGDAVHASKAESLESACKVLGVDEIIKLDLPDMRLDSLDHVDLNRALENVLTTGVFQTVLVHHRDDINLDHRLIYQSLLVAARPTPEQCIQNILTYQVNSSTEWGGRTSDTIFVPNIFIDIEETIEKKITAFEHYQDEIRPYPHPRSSDAIRDRAKVYGVEAGYRYGEAFRLILARSAALS